MTPVESAINQVGRAIGSFHPTSMPSLARAHYRREIVAWIFLPLMLGAVEGGVVGVIAKNAFVGAVSDGWLSIAVALLSGAPAFANVTSFLWASLSHGRRKIRFLVGLQIAASLLVASIALAPQNGLGLAILVGGAVGARICWAGVVTLRSTVWRANYPRDVRARMAGKLVTVQAIMLASIGLAIGLAMRANEQSYHVLFPIAAGLGGIGAVIYSRMRMRGERALIAAEREGRDGRPAAVSPTQIWRVLYHDKPFRRYMGAMFIFGIGNLSVIAPLVIMLRDVFHFGYLRGILITATIPVLVMPMAIPFWSRLFDRMHIVRFRSIHCWSFVATNVAVLLGAMFVWPSLLWLAAVLRGIGFGGGVLGWNLGHHDFTTTENASQYMGVHVTLTGIRGLIGPPLAVALYEWLEPSRGGAGAAAWVFGICLALNVAGAAAFLRLGRIMTREERLAISSEAG